MKIIYILLLSSILNANCSEKEINLSNQFFLKASQEQSIEAQMLLLKQSLNACFSYEVEVSLLMLKATQSSATKKLKLYDQALESLSKITSNDDLVLREQNRINQLLAKLYKSTDKEMSDIYRKKTIDPKSAETKETPSYWFYLLIVIIAMWIILGFFRRA